MIASLFHENCISFNIANSSRFGRMIDKSVEFSKQSPLQNDKTFFTNEKELLSEVAQRPF